MILKTIVENTIKKYKITADQITIIEAMFQKDHQFMEELMQIEKQRILLLQNLVRRGFLGLNDEELGFELSYNLYVTDKGEEVISTLKQDFNNLKNMNVEFDKTNFEVKFNEFWDTFPTSDKYSIYPRTRVLRSDQEHIRKNYRKILQDYSHEEIMKALKYEIEMRKNNSNGKDYSNFKYMKAIATWLNTKEFLAINELMKEDTIEVKDIFSRDV